MTFVYRVEIATQFIKFNTYMSVAVQRVVGELDLVEDHGLGRPVRSKGRTVRMQVHPLGTLRFGATGRDPLGATELEAAIADGDHLNQHAVVFVRFKAVNRQAHRGKHPSVSKRKKERTKGTKVRVVARVVTREAVKMRIAFNTFRPWEPSKFIEKRGPY